MSTTQDEADRVLGARIRELLAAEVGEKYPHRADSWHARVLVRRYDVDVNYKPCVPYYYCNIGDGISQPHPTLDAAVVEAKPDA